MKKSILTFLLIVLLCALCACNNDAPSNNDTPSNTASCDELGHEMAYTSSSSVHVYKCTREGCTYAEAPKAHRGGIATCTAPGICTDCGMEYQKKTEHIFAGATCSKPGNCTVCNAEGGEQPPHTFTGATCTELAKCTVCGATGGELLPHNYEGATCTALGKCTACGAAGGELSDEGHNIVAVGEPCTLCGADYVDVTLEYRFSDSEAAYVVTGIGRCELTEIVIPAEHFGKPVTAIADYAFMETRISEITVPDTVKTLGTGAFKGCTELKRVNLPDELKVIPDDAFDSCVLLEQIELPSSLEAIGAFAFSLTAITQIECPQGLKSIGESAFNSTPLAQIILNDALEYIGVSAFSFTDIESVTIPSGIKTVEENLFAESTRLKNVVLTSVENIESEAFSGCISLESISIPNCIEYIHFRAFSGCAALQYEIKGGLGYLGNSDNPTLVLCKYIEGTELSITDTTKMTLNYVAEDIDTITSLYISASLIKLGGGAFLGLDGLVSVSVSENNPKYYATGNCIIERDTKTLVRAYKGYDIPSDGSVESVNLSAFNSLETIENIMIPSGVKHVYVSMRGCAMLKKIVIGPDVEKVEVGINFNNGTYKVFICNTKEKWEKNMVKLDLSFGVINSQNDKFSIAEHYFYSDTEPTEEGKFWHYVNGVPTPW